MKEVLVETITATQTIDVISCTVYDLFNAAIQSIDNSDVTGILTIPEYQRPYLWSSKEVGKLITDLETHFKSEDMSKPMYYLGSIIIHQENEKLNIIDGQQRITTLGLILSALNQSVPTMKYDSPISIFNIQKNYKYIISEEFIPRIQNIDVSQVNVTLIITRNEDDAYTFFETQNTGGIRLTGVDIIKAHHLRSITPKGGQQDYYAQIWEKQNSLELIIEQLIKARRWGILNWRDVPSDRDLKGTKNSIIVDFSERTITSNEKFGYQHVQLSDNYSRLLIPSSSLAIRQPIVNGENFIDYLKVFSELYQRLFNKADDKEIPDEYYKFNKEVIKVVDGTGFLKELYEIAMLCYVNRFGFKNILEASFWIFRYSYSIRVINQKTVKENSIPSFIKNGNYLFDHILSCFNHNELIVKLKSFNYTFNRDNLEGNTVKSRYIVRLSKYFEGQEITTEIERFKKDFDKQLVKNIKRRINGSNV